MTLKNAAYFCGGAVLGVLGTVSFLWFWEAPDPAEDISEKAQEKIVPTEKPASVDKSSLDLAPAVSVEQIQYYTLAQNLYAKSEDASKDIPTNHDEPVQIDEELFYELSLDGRYDTQTLVLYSDAILANSVTDEIMSASDTFVALGPNYTIRAIQRELDRCAEMYIRNDHLYTLYEITPDSRTYREVTGGEY